MGHLVYGCKGEGASNVLSSVSVFGLAVVVWWWSMIYCYKSSCQNGSFIAPPMGNKKATHNRRTENYGVGENKAREGNGVKLHPHNQRDKETCILLDYLIIR